MENSYLPIITINHNFVKISRSINRESFVMKMAYV